MRSRSFRKMEMPGAASISLLAILFATATVASSLSEPVFVTLTQSFKIKVPRFLGFFGDHETVRIRLYHRGRRVFLSASWKS
jgi:hypothetical protein